jgi:hypothetical protein
MTPRELLVEAAVSAWRPRSAAGAIQPHPAWADLDDAARRQVCEETLLMRLVESALDPDGLSTTTRAVLARIRGQGRG